MRRTLACCLSIGLMFCLDAAVSSSQAQDRLPRKKTSAQADRPEQKTINPVRAAGADPLPVVEKVGLAGLERILQEDSGKVVLLNAWTSWCKPCAEEMPGLLKAWMSFPKKAVSLVLLS